MSGRGKGGKGLGAYHAHISPKMAKTMFLKVLPKKYHKVFLEKDFDNFTVERWLNTVLEGPNWKKTTLRQELTQQFQADKPVRFVKVAELTPAYSRQKKDYATKKVVRARKKKLMVQLVQTPYVKFAVGSPEYVKAMQHYQQMLKKSMML